MSFTPADDSKRRSLTSLIGWLSLCLLAAGWGAQLDSTFRELWANIGLLGLASAIGLEVVQRTRRENHRRKQRRVTNLRIEQSLKKHADGNATFQQLKAALRRITEADQDRPERVSGKHGELRLPFHRQVLVKLLDENGSVSTAEDGATFRASIRDISANGVGLIHNQPIPTGRVMLTFKLGNGETISIFANLLWQHRQADGEHSSGGKLIEVITPVSRCEPVTAGAG